MARVSILAVRPHPDDECTGTGGILALYAGRHEPVGVLTCTLGEEGEILDPELDPEEARPRLGQIREGELRAACKVLGVSELRLLGYRDSGMAGAESNSRPDAFCRAPLDEAGGRVAGVIRELRPRVVLTENEHGTYGHPDHVMCHRVAVRGVEMAADPAFRSDGLVPWQVDRLFATEMVVEGGEMERIGALLRAEQLDLGWFEHADELRGLGIPASEADVAIDVSDYVEVMREALRRHRSQIPPDSFLLRWPAHILREVFRTAYFKGIPVAGQPPAGSAGSAPLADLLKGLP